MDNPVFQNFKKASNKQLLELKPSDIELFARDEIPENYTLVASPTEEVLQAIHRVAEKCPNYVRGQYWYPDSEVHLTMIGNMSVSTNVERMVGAVRSAIQRIIPEFRMLGVASNMHAVSLSCYPQNFSLYEFRQRVRSFISNPSDDYTVHLQEYEYMGWVNCMRYLRRPTDAELAEFRLLMPDDFGIFKPTKLHLYKNKSKVLKSEKRALIAEFALC
ncbi:hypothetical protein KBB12_02530 [Candidatus Woesebacteria bacterium]|nr:hypothetical protein [Candidatus Woesebacteria bacterium]